MRCYYIYIRLKRQPLSQLLDVANRICQDLKVVKEVAYQTTPLAILKEYPGHHRVHSARQQLALGN